MTVVRKYPYSQMIEMPVGAEVITARYDVRAADGICEAIYALVDKNETKTEPHYFTKVPAGSNPNNKGNAKYLITVNASSYLYNIYEINM